MDNLAIVAIFRQEALYLREWVEFHRLVGVSKFYLYQNRSDDAWEPICAPYVASGLLDITEWPNAACAQPAAYQHALQRLSGLPLWLAFIDCDESLFSPAFDTVPQALATLPKNWGAVGVNWMCFGSSGQQEYSPEPVIERFTWRPKTESHFNLHIKSIVRADQRAEVGPTPHHFVTQNGTFNELGEPVLGPFTNGHHSNLLRINHYSSKSRGEWLLRSKLGKPDRDTMDIDPAWYDERQAMDVDDRDIWRFLPALKERLAK